MKIFAGVLAATALLAFTPAVQAQPYTPNYGGYVPHQKTGGNHPGGHSSVTGHKKNGGGTSASGGSSGGGAHVHTGSCGHTCYSCQPPKPKPVARCFPPGHCKSINSNPQYYGPPGQNPNKGGGAGKGRKG